MTNTFAGPLRANKRSISVMEKKCFKNFGGRALVMPGMPHVTYPQDEIQELVDAAGFDLEDIVAVDNSPEVANALFEKYRDQIPIYVSPVELFLEKSVTQYSYIHLDYCGFLKQSGVEIAGIYHAARKTTPYARIRVTTADAQRNSRQFDYERDLQERSLILTCQIHGWSDLISEAKETIEQTTTLIGFLILINSLFCMTFDEYYDFIVAHKRLPPVLGRNCPHTFNQWRYGEPGSPNRMFTCWSDLAPIPYLWHNDPAKYVHDMIRVFTRLPLTVFDNTTFGDST